MLTINKLTTPELIVFYSFFFVKHRTVKSFVYFKKLKLKLTNRVLNALYGYMRLYQFVLCKFLYQYSIFLIF